MILKVSQDNFSLFKTIHLNSSGFSTTGSSKTASSFEREGYMFPFVVFNTDKNVLENIGDRYDSKATMIVHDHISLTTIL